MISLCTVCNCNVSENLSFWTYFYLFSRAAKVLKSSKNAVVTQQNNQVKQQYILIKNCFWNFPTFCKVLVGQKNAYSKVTSCIPLTHLNLKKKSIIGTLQGLQNPLFPLGNNGTKLSLLFGAYLYSVASIVTPQGEASSWETAKAFCDFINFTKIKGTLLRFVFYKDIEAL